MVGELVPIQILPGVEPPSDKPEATTRHYTFSNRIRFKDGLPEKIGGWRSITLDSGDSISGKARSIFSYLLSGVERYVIGTNTRLYDVTGSSATNITPVQTATTAIANSLDSNYGGLANNALFSFNGETTLTVTQTGTRVRTGDTITISGAVGFNGIPAVDINTTHFVRNALENNFTVQVNTAATAGGFGGGAGIVLATPIVTVNATAHGLSEGDRIEIAGAATFAGIPAGDLNIQHIIRTVDTNDFDIVVDTIATSSVTGGGGAGTTLQDPIAPGLADTTAAQGYGAGLYGVGLYGVSKSSASGVVNPRRWSHDRFGDLTVHAPGEGAGVYQWDANVTAAPALITNAPPQANYVFVTNSIVVVLGYDTNAASANENGISWCSQGAITNWTTGSAGGDSIEGAGRFISHAKARSENLLFTINQTYIFRFIGGQFTFQTVLLDANVGCIAQNARVEASGVIYWMGLNNFYMWRGGNVEVIPSNSSSESTILKFVFDNMNYAQKEKIFAWYNPEFREIWWHYPSEGSNEPDRIARLNIDTYVWCPDLLDRTAAEYPSIITQNPYLIDDNETLYLHEDGVNDDGEGMNWALITRRFYGGSSTVQHKAYIPDFNLTGEFSLNLVTRDYPTSSNKTNRNYTVTTTTGRQPTEQNGRFWQYVLLGTEVDQTMEMGQWYEELERSSAK